MIWVKPSPLLCRVLNIAQPHSDDSGKSEGCYGTSWAKTGTWPDPPEQTGGDGGWDGMNLERENLMDRGG